MKNLSKNEKQNLLFRFYDETETTILFWNDVFEEFEILMLNDSPLVRKYKYFGKILSNMTKFFISLKNENFNSDIVKEDIETIQMIYTVYKSDEAFINHVYDSELYEFDIIFDNFFDLVENMRETNMLKTTYLCKRLLTLCEKNFSLFLKRYPKIKNDNIKLDPESGMEYMEF